MKLFIMQFSPTSSNPYKTTGKITVLHIIIFTYLDGWHCNPEVWILWRAWWWT
jgi:hypothetical protein